MVEKQKIIIKHREGVSNRKIAAELGCLGKLFRKIVMYHGSDVFIQKLVLFFTEKIQKMLFFKQQQEITMFIPKFEV
ncbi:MAG: hypothetical protein K6F00_08820 [Lachnospiraceae bacterium]|nr:hypothetical protein [Lachnospiraceae bacterium]